MLNPKSHIKKIQHKNPAQWKREYAFGWKYNQAMPRNPAVLDVHVHPGLTHVDSLTLLGKALPAWGVSSYEPLSSHFHLASGLGFEYGSICVPCKLVPFILLYAFHHHECPTFETQYLGVIVASSTGIFLQEKDSTTNKGGEDDERENCQCDCESCHDDWGPVLHLMTSPPRNNCLSLPGSLVCALHSHFLWILIFRFPSSPRLSPCRRPIYGHL